MNDEKNVDLTNNIKKQNQKLGKNSKKLGQELEGLFRDFNGLMRFFYQEYSFELDRKDRHKVRNKFCDKKPEREINVEREDKNPPIIKSTSARKIKKKRIIVWNAWVIDTSSESSCESE